MILFLYSLALHGVLIVGAPFWLFRMATTSKYRHGISERLGRVPRRLLDVDPGKLVIWVHAVSVGEVLAASRLISELQNSEHEGKSPSREVFLSTTTRTGQTLARTRFGKDRVFYFPLDVRWAIRRYMRALKPSMVVLVETEFWPNMLGECASRNIPVVVVNARISDRSYPHYMRLRSVWRRILSSLTLVLAQSEEDVRRLKSIGISDHRVIFGGNLKYDMRPPEATAFTAAMRCSLKNETRLLVAGSTLEGEELILVAAWPRLLAATPELVMLLAPRHPERFNAVAQLLREMAESGSEDRREVDGRSSSGSGPIHWERGSEWMRAPHQLEPGTILLLDSIGDLASVYSLAAVAFVGGSLVPSGGHNPLEPALFGVPIVIGPHYFNFRAVVDEFVRNSAIRIADKDSLAATLAELLMDGSNTTGQRGKDVFERNAGATKRALNAITALLEQRAHEAGSA